MTDLQTDIADDDDDDDDRFCDHCGGPFSNCYCDDCPKCNGTGRVYFPGNYIGDGSSPCPSCCGQGTI